MAVSAEASVYSGSAPVHDSVTLVPGSFKRLLRSTEEAVRIGLLLSWNLVWMKPTYAELRSTMALASDIGVNRIRILRLMLNGRAWTNRSQLELDMEMMRRSAEVFQTLSLLFPRVTLAYSKPLAFQLAGKDDCQPSCGAGLGQLVVQADGVVLPCVGMRTKPPFSIGDVRKETLEQILARSEGNAFTSLSRRFHECPAVIYRQEPALVQISV